MGHHKRQEIEERDLEGFKYFKRIARLLERLHAVGCVRDRAHNRQLHMDQYVLLLLLYMFNPLCVSLRSLQQASTLKKVQRCLGVARSSLGSLSEAHQVFDSELLLGLIEELAAELPAQPHDARLNDLGAVVTLVDGTVLAALPRVVRALWFGPEGQALKAHVQFELLKGVPVRATLTDAHRDEREVLRENLQPGRLYVADRGYLKFQIFQDILDAGSHFVTRLRDNTVLQVEQERELSAAALKAGVVRDAVVRLGGPDSPLRPAVRVVEVECQPHRKPAKTGRGGPEQGDTILVVTDRLDLPPEVVALLYQCRWQIEIFFRVFKHLLGCRHLLSHSQEGIALQVYVAILASMLIALYTGAKPTLRTFEMLNWYLLGWADLDELEAHIAQLKKQA